MNHKFPPKLIRKKLDHSSSPVLVQNWCWPLLTWNVGYSVVSPERRCRIKALTNWHSIILCLHPKVSIPHTPHKRSCRVITAVRTNNLTTWWYVYSITMCIHPPMVRIYNFWSMCSREKQKICDCNRSAVKDTNEDTWADTVCTTLQ